MSDNALLKLIGGLSAEKRSMLSRLLHPRPEPIAIVGMGCRFPGGADHPEAFWQLLRDEVDAVGEVPSGRWDAQALYNPEPGAPGKITSRWGGFLSQVDQFDAQFFGISDREAESMDPQQRLLLEVAWEALEDAGLPAEHLRGSKTGVFVGLCANDYARMLYADAERIDAHTGAGAAASIVANRLSYLLDLQGPSIAVDTACSSSLVAVHLACQSLRADECRLAVAAGVNLILSPGMSITFSKARMLSADGRCKTFDSRADGFGRGEGCGAIVLKRLSDATADGDDIRAVIRGSALNQVGRSNGMTAPNGLAQQAVLRQALEAAGLQASEVSYIEAHGTGTSLGDPIEVESLAEVYGQPRSAGETCFLGSVKTNIGHLEGAAGIAGLIKVVLSLQHGLIPANLHFRKLNPNIALAGTPFAIPTHLQEWPSRSPRRCAGVSAFGFGGTNAHVILEEFVPPPRLTIPSRAVHLLLLSAQDRQALRALAAAYIEQLDGQGDTALHDICYSANLRRTHHRHRLAIVGQSGREFLEQLRAFHQAEALPQSVRATQPGEGRSRLAFVFAGQEVRYWGIGRTLAEREPVFRTALAECDTYIRPCTGRSVLEAFAAEPSEWPFYRFEFAQLSAFAVQVALAALWKSWGIQPDAVVGYGLAEAAAAHVAGSLNLEDAVNVVFQQARLLQCTVGPGRGRMLATELDRPTAEKWIAGYEDRVAVAAIESPSATVLSGETAAIEAVLQDLPYCAFGRWLPGDYALHSPQMAGLQAELVQALSGITVRPATTAVFSTLKSQTSSNFDAHYWGRAVREPINYAAAIDALISQGYDQFIEISPHPDLARATRQCLDYRGRQGAVLPSLERDKDEQATLLTSLGALYTRGYAGTPWQQPYACGGRLVRLPSYPWQRQRYWWPTAKRS